MKVHHCVWDYLAVWICETGKLYVSSERYAKDRTALKIFTGETPDISEHLDFEFYDWATYWNYAGLGWVRIGRWIVVSHKFRQIISLCILTVSWRPITCINVQQLTEEEQENDEYGGQMEQFNTLLNKRLEAKYANINITSKPDWNWLSIDKLDPEFDDEFHKVISDDDVPHADEAQPKEEPTHTSKMFNSYIDMEIGLPRVLDR